MKTEIKNMDKNLKANVIYHTEKEIEDLEKTLDKKYELLKELKTNE